MYTTIEPLRSNIVRVSHTPQASPPPPSPLRADAFCADPHAASFCRALSDGRIVFERAGETFLCQVEADLREKPLFRYVVDGEPVLRRKQTANGEVEFIENAREIPDGTAYAGRLSFRADADASLYGLGQHENGVFDYNNQTEYLYQNNMIIALPFLLSSENYGILLDTETAAVFQARDGAFAFSLDTVDALSYYVIIGDGFDEIIAALRGLTGKAVMPPRWAFGYIQSKERYQNAAELVETVSRFRREGIPLDGIVQDWCTWEEGHWGEKRPDALRYPDLPALLDALHERHARLMVSVWPNMARESADYGEFASKGLLLAGSLVYNAFDESARALYWEQCRRHWFDAGTDAWWCDNTEPFSDADWNGAQKRTEALRYGVVTDESKKFIDWRRVNTYGLAHARGIYENWRKSGSPKRVVNLTRSTYLSGQRYGVIAWSGDVCATWETLRRQITEGIKFSMSGMPYWTLDIGGFFTVKDKWENRGCNKAGDATPLWFWNGDYNDGTADLGYRELYVRWFQLGAFLPIFRAHGTDTPREPWRFGKPGTPFYDALMVCLRLRYRLLPYLYACAAAVTFEDQTMMRALMFDFAHDARCRRISDCFMLGKALYVCPVTRPMYYGPNSAALPDGPKTREVYLPNGALWYDFWTGKAYPGGRQIPCDAPLQIIPLFVRAGSILPLSDPLTYADERSGEVAELVVYGGADGRFVLYNDEGDTYAYERGGYCAIETTYRHADRTLTLGKASGKYPFQRTFVIRLQNEDGTGRSTQIAYGGEALTIRL